MTFQEKTAWIMTSAITLAGLFYVKTVLSISQAAGQLAAPNVPSIIGTTGVMILIAIIGHIVIAYLAPKEANAEPDEREKDIGYRASHWSGYVLAAGILVSLGLYLYTLNGNMLFYAAFASLIISHVSEYLFQIVLNRTVVL